jgi:predicted dienelactone hydrolase
VLAAAAGALFCRVAPAGAEELAITLGGLAVTVWEPAGAAPAPLVIFSHGFHGCATQSRFLTQALADAGYLVAAPNHRDATCGADPARWLDKPQEPFRRVAEWSDATFRDRADDIRGLLAALHTDLAFRDRIDWRHVALAGHSLGGYTALGLAGAWPACRIEGVSAVLALSPYAQPFMFRHTLAAIAVPVMYQGGTFDFGITPALREPDGAYAQSRAPKYFVDFAGAGHLAWADIGRRDHAQIVDYSLAFLDHYLRDAPAAAMLTQPAAGVALLRFDSELGSGERVPAVR